MIDWSGIYEIHIDKETYSEADIKWGAYAYAADISTDVLNLKYWWKGIEKRRLWVPGDPYPFKGYGGRFLAWNANFERLIWLYVMTDLYDWPEPEIEWFECVAAQARLQG